MNPTDCTKWTMGNFVLSVLSRSTVNDLGETTRGTEKKLGCTGKGVVYKEGINGTGSTTEVDFTDEIPHKGANNRCKCEFVAQYVTDSKGVTGEGTGGKWGIFLILSAPVEPAYSGRRRYELTSPTSPSPFRFREKEKSLSLRKPHLEKT